MEAAARRWPPSVIGEGIHPDTLRDWTYTGVPAYRVVQLLARDDALGTSGAPVSAPVPTEPEARCVNAAQEALRVGEQLLDVKEIDAVLYDWLVQIIAAKSAEASAKKAGVLSTHERRRQRAGARRS